MRVRRIFGLAVLVGAGLAWMPASMQAQGPSAFLAVQNTTFDPAASTLRVMVKNVGERRITGVAVLVGSQQFTQEYVYSVGVDSKLAGARPAGFGGIAPGESLELLFPLGEGKMPTVEVNAVVFEDRTAVGDEAQISAIFRHRLAYATEWERWALVMQEDPLRTASSAAREAETAEMLKTLPVDPDGRGDAETVSGRMAARRALAALLAQANDKNWAALLAYVRERAAKLRWHAERQGGASFARMTAAAIQSPAKLQMTDVKIDQFACRQPGQLFTSTGHTDVTDGRPGYTLKTGSLSIVAMGVCGTEGLAGAAFIPTCGPEFFTTTSASTSSATLTGMSYSALPVGCLVISSQTVNSSSSASQLFLPEASLFSACDATASINSADVTTDTISTTLAPSDVSGSFSLWLSNDDGSVTYYLQSGVNRTGGTYSDSFNVNSAMPLATFTKIFASWTIGAFQVGASRQYAFRNLGRTHHSRYTVVQESTCGGPQMPVYIITNLSACYSNGLQSDQLPNDFASQTRLNGTGQSISWSYLKPILATSCSNATAGKPADATPQNTFVQVPSVTGACNSALDDSKVAAYNHVCGQQIQIQDYPSAGSRTQKAVQDECPACRYDAPHFDNFTAAPGASCSTTMTDLGTGYYITLVLQ